MPRCKKYQDDPQPIVIIASMLVTCVLIFRALFRFGFLPIMVPLRESGSA